MYYLHKLFTYSNKLLPKLFYIKSLNLKRTYLSNRKKTHKIVNYISVV